MRTTSETQANWAGGRIDAVLFDKDGTLFDFEASWAPIFATILDSEAHGDPARAAMLGEAIGFDTRRGRFAADSVAIAGTTREVAARLLPLLSEERLDRLVARLDARTGSARPVPAAPLGPLMARLAAAGLRLGVATNDAEASARAHLAAAGILGRFDFVAGADSGFGAKPGPGQLLAFAAETGVVPARIAMVGDSGHDLAAAEAAAMVPVAVLTGPTRRAELEPRAAAVLGSIAELPAWLGLADAAQPA